MNYAKVYRIRVAAVVLLAVLVLALAGVGAYSVGAQGTVTPSYTPRPSSTPVFTETPFLTPTPAIPLPNLPDWPGSYWYLSATDTYLPGCPDWSLIDPAAGSVEDLAWEWRAMCSHCLPFGVGGAVGDEVTPVSYKTPSPTPVPVGFYELSNYVDWDHEINYYKNDPAPGMAPEYWQHFYATFPPESYFISGLLMTVSHTGTGDCKLRTDPDRAGSVFSDSSWLEPGQYCFGPLAACSSLAPGREVVSNYRVIPPGSSSVVSFQIGSYPTVCENDQYTVSDLNWILYRTNAAYTPTPVPSPTSASGGYFRSCVFNFQFDHSAGTSVHESLLGGSNWSSPDTVEAVMFSIPPGAYEVRLSRDGGGGDEAFWPEDLDGFLAQPGLYCVGSLAACNASGWEWSYNYLIGGPWLDMSGTRYSMGFEITSAEDVTAWIAQMHYIFAGSDTPECQTEEGTPTPTPTVTGTVMPTATPGASCAIRWDDAASTFESAIKLSSWGFTEVSTWELRAWGVQNGGGTLGYMRPRANPEVATNSALSSLVVEAWEDGAGTLTGGFSLYSGASATSSVYQMTGCTSVAITGGYRYTCSAAAFGSRPYFRGILGAVDYISVGGTASVRFRIISCNGNPGYEDTTPTPTPTNTPTPTYTPTPLLTRTPIFTPTPTPQIGGDFCQYAAFKEDMPIITDWTFPNGGDIISKDPPECWTIIPGINFSLPSVLGGQTFDLPRAEVCLQRVYFPVFSVFGIPFAMDWLLIPIVAFLIRHIMSI